MLSWEVEGHGAMKGKIAALKRADLPRLVQQCEVSGAEHRPAGEHPHPSAILGAWAVNLWRKKYSVSTLFLPRLQETSGGRGMR